MCSYVISGSSPRARNASTSCPALSVCPALPSMCVLICPALHSMCVSVTFTVGLCRVGEHPLVRVSLHPPLEGQLQLGSTLAGTLDFRFSQSAAQQDAAAPKCVQVVVMLETEERVQDQWQARSKRQVAPIRKVNMRSSTTCTYRQQ